jgi:hypothetical protein
LEGSGLGLILRLYPGICLEDLRKTTEYLNQNSRFPGQDLNPEPPEYEATVSVNHSNKKFVAFM